MLKKIAEALAARTDPDFVIIARTNARRVYDLDEALRRAEAFHKAGADMLFVHTRNPEEMRIVGERLPPPLMTFAPADGFSDSSTRRMIWPVLATALPRPPARLSRPWSKPCASPTSVWRKGRWTLSWVRAAPTRK